MTFKTKLAPILSAVALAIITPVATPVAAQQAQQQQVPTIAPEDVTDAQIVSFVEAFEAVQAVRQEYGPRIQDAKDKSAQQDIAKKANAAALDAVKATDNMDLHTYVAIAHTAQKDKGLNTRIMARIKKVRGGE